MATEATSSPSPQAMLSWVDRMHMVPLSDSQSNIQYTTDANARNDNVGGSGSNADRKPLEFNIASLNVLAESYLTPRSHGGLPKRYAEVAFDTVKRRRLLLDTLERFCGPSSVDKSDDDNADDDRRRKKWDVLALQELDMVQPDDPILPAFESWGYEVVRTPTDRRRDCSAIAFDASKFSLVNYEVVNFDDLATLQPTNKKDEDAARGDVGDGSRLTGKTANGTSPVNFHNITPTRTNSPPELTGMVRSFLRRNCAVVAHLKSVETEQSLVVASVHLYWHPGYEYVKLCQAKYLLDRVAAFASNETRDIDDVSATSTATEGGGASNRIPTIISGDMNSKPGSIVHKLFVKPHVDARTVAPWRYFWDEDKEEIYTEDDENFGEGSLDESGDEKDCQDPMVGEGSTLAMGAAVADKEDEVGGYTMAGLDSDFAMYCGTIDSNSGLGENSVENLSVLENEKPPQPSNSEKDDAEIDPLKDINSGDKLKATLAWRRLNKHKTPQDYQHSTPAPPVKYHLDYTLNRFTRWLRILGIDATLEKMEEEKERTSGGSNIALFDHCKNEQRTLLTTSYKLLLRKECPPGAYLLDPKRTSDLELALPRLLRTHGIELSPCTFLTRCVLCNGRIDRVLTGKERKAVFVDHGAPALVDSKENIEVFRCDRCGQGYWWDDTPSSSASRVFTQATKLLRLCLRGGVAVKDETISDDKKRKVVMGAFDFVNVEKERESEGSASSDTELSVIEWLGKEKLSSAFSLRSAYAAQRDTVRESLPFTNVTKDFVGCLDYIFFEPTQFDQICKLNVPTSFRGLNASGSSRGHLIPSDIWPSDHLAVGARFRLKQDKTGDGQTKVAGENGTNNPMSKESLSRVQSNTNNTKSAHDGTAKPIFHPTRCDCGCVPNILSLYEMAELRKKAREKKAAEAAASTLSK